VRVGPSANVKKKKTFNFIMCRSSKGAGITFRNFLITVYFSCEFTKGDF